MQRILFLHFIILLFVFGQAGAETSADLDIKSIKVLDLETAQKIALSENPSLKAAEDRIIQAKERVVQAQSAYWPRVDAALSGSRAWRSDTSLTAMGNPEDPEDRFRTGISAAWILFNGFERKFRNLSAKYGEKGSHAANMDTRRLLLLSTASGFFNAQLARENIAIASANEVFNSRQAKDARARKRAGTGSLSDVLNFKVQVNFAKAGVIRAKKEYKAAMFALAALLGIPEASFPEDMKLAELKKETPEELSIPETKPLIAYAQTHRPDILQISCALKSAESGIGQAKAGFWPVVSLSGSIDGERTEDMGFDGDDFGSSAGLNFSYNIFEGGSTRSKVREAYAGKSEIENLLKNMRISVTSQVLDAVESLKLSREHLLLERINADLVLQNRSLVEKEYKAGQTSLVRLNEAQRDLIEAQSRLASARVSLRQAWHNLRAATGENLCSEQ